MVFYFKWLAMIVGVIVLMSAPLTEPFRTFRPDLFFLFLVYWSTRAPKQFGPTGAFILGIIEDVFYFSPLGLHAALYVAMMSLFKKWKWSASGGSGLQLYVIVIGFLLTKISVVVFVHSLLTQYEPTTKVWLPALSTLLLFTLMQQWMMLKRTGMPS